jgi:hypothetical protein
MKVWLLTVPGQLQWRDRAGLAPASPLHFKDYFNPMSLYDGCQGPVESLGKGD